MKHEALYASVIGAVPTVLIGYVLEIRYLLSKLRPGAVLGKTLFIPTTIVATFLSALLSVVALGYGSSNETYAALVASTFLIGMVGLASLLLGSVLRPLKAKRKPTP